MNDSGADDACCRSYPNACDTFQSPDRSDCPAVKSDHSLAAGADHLPFVAQDGRMLYLVAGDVRGWILAELEFDAASCTFSLRRQIEYRWPREALGRLLSRMLASEPAEGEIIRLSDAFSDWLATQFAA